MEYAAMLLASSARLARRGLVVVSTAIYTIGTLGAPFIFPSSVSYFNFVC